jgi:hypothetical protein
VRFPGNLVAGSAQRKIRRHVSSESFAPNQKLELVHSTRLESSTLIDPKILTNTERSNLCDSENVKM